MFHQNNRKKYLCHFDDDDMIIENFRLNPVHRLPQGEWKPEQEIDFYMDDGKNIYFLRIINCNGNMIQLMDDNLHKNLRWIIVCTQVEDTFAILKKIIKRLKEIPYASKINQKEQGYYLLNWI